MVSAQTCEGNVYLTLLKKLELEQKALGGKVFDVLGKAIAGAELRELLIQAIRYGDRPDVRERLNQVVADRLARTGKIRFIEVKGRIESAETVTVTKNEILTALNKPKDFILALVQVPKSEEFSEGDAFKVSASKGKYNVGNDGCVVHYVRHPFQKEPDFGVTSVNYSWKELWQKGIEPE